MPTAGRLWSRGAEGVEVRFHSGQRRAWESRKRFVFVVAGTQSGKTSWGPWWLWREIYGLPGHPGRGPGDYLAVTATYDLFKLKMLPALRECFEEAMGSGRWRATERAIELADPATRELRGERGRAPWGRILLRSAAAGAGLESATARAAWLDECGQDGFRLETWEAVLRRLSLAQGRALGTTTPYNMGWLKTEVFERWRAGDPRFDVIRFHSTENPAFPRAEYERARETMPAWRFRMFYEGELARPEGLVYDCFDEAAQSAPERRPPPDWPRWVGVDFGAVNTALVWVAEDPACGRYEVYRESLEGGLSTPEHARRALAEAAGVHVAAFVGGAPGEEQQRMDWARAGVPVRRPPVRDVEAGIDRVTELLRTRRLFVQRSCRGLLEEMGSYRRRLDAAGHPTDDIEEKARFHRLDALRYAVCGMLGGRVTMTEGWLR